MTNRIPPSLNWLVKQRSKIHGELISLNKERTLYIEWFDKKVEDLQADLTAVDRTLKLHEIKISPKIIPPKTIRPITKNFNHGDLTKCIIECIRKSKDNTAHAKQIIQYVGKIKEIELSDKVSYKTLNNSVRNRIKNMCRSGEIYRVPLNDVNHVRHYKLTR